MDERRNNQQWIEELRGDRGGDLQQQAYLDLANFLYKVAYNYLCHRQPDVAHLAAYNTTELAAMAEDFTQDVLMKLYENDGTRLCQFRGDGRFLGWAALIVRNHVAGILQRVRYQREVPPPPSLVHQSTTEPTAEKLLALQEVGAAFQACLDRLTDARRQAFIDCIYHNKPSIEVAKALACTVNAVDQRVMHAKRQIRACLEAKGVGPEILQLFG